MDRRYFLRAGGGLGAVGIAGAAGWTLRGNPSPPDLAARLENVDSLGVGSGGFGAYGVPRLIFSVPVTGKYAALTFDDGPDPEFTPAVLAILAKYKISATFNVMGYNAVHHTDLLRATIDAGHEIGNHTWTHLDLSGLGPAETRYEIHHGRTIIEELGGVKIRYFRPPRGEISGYALRVVAEEGNDLLMWSVTGSVPGRETPEAVNAFVLAHLEPGAVIDYHDGIGRGTFDRHSPGARSLIARRNAEIKGLPAMIETAMAQGYTFMSVSQLLSHEEAEASPSMTEDESSDPDIGQPHVTNPPDATIPSKAATPAVPTSN